MKSLYVSAIALVAAGPAFAVTSKLTSHSGGGACGGSVSCYLVDDQSINNPAAGVQANSAIHSTMPDGSYANAHATASFGAEHVYADAYRAPLSVNPVYGDAQSRGSADAIDYVAAMANASTQNFALTVSGSHSPTDGDYATSAYAYVQLLVLDQISGTLLNKIWISTDAVPTFSFATSLLIPAHDAISIELYFEADAYTLNYGYGPDYVNGVYPVHSDYSHTLKLNIDPAAGSSPLSFSSGHNYASPAIPEPGVWAMLIAGFGVVGAAARRRRNTAIAA